MGAYENSNEIKRVGRKAQKTHEKRINNPMHQGGGNDDEENKVDLNKGTEETLLPLEETSGSNPECIITNDQWITLLFASKKIRGKYVGE